MSLRTRIEAFAQQVGADVKALRPARTSTTSSATPTPTGGSAVNQLILTAQAVAGAFVNPTGVPGEGNYVEIKVKDDGTARSLTWGSAYKASDNIALPTSTVVGKTLYLLFRYNAVTAKWVLLAKDTET